MRSMRPDEMQPAGELPFTLTPAGAGTAAVRLGSFGIAKAGADRLKLVIKGYDSPDLNAPPVIEQKVVASFQERQKLTVRMFLGSACYDRATLCAGLTTTCTTDVARAGTCVPLPTAQVATSSAPGDGKPAGDGSADREPCAENNGGCAQSCTVAAGQAVCGCGPGYALVAATGDCSETYGWSPPAVLAEGVYPRLPAAMNRVGDAVVAWQAYPSSSSDMQLRRFSGGAWEPPIAVGIGWPNSNLQVFIARDAAVRIVASDGLRSASDAQRGASWLQWTRGGSPTLEVIPAPAEASAKASPRCAAADDGNTVCIWSDPDGAGEHYSLQRRQAATGSWFSATLVGAASDGASFPAVAVNEAGTSAALINGEELTLVLGDAGASLPVPEANADDVSGLLLGMDLEGNLLAVWQEDSLRWSRYDAARRAWSRPEWLSTKSIRAYDFAMLPTGEAVVAWVEIVSVQPYVAALYARRYAEGRWSEPEPLGAPGSVGNPYVALNARGQALAVWAEGGAQGAIVASRNAGRRWNAPARVGSYGPNGQPAMKVMLGDEGRALLLWLSLGSAATEKYDLMWSQLR